ncbi:MAG: hypothetical protein ACR2MW_01760 [Chthoniobacterales bacterium]
MKSKSMLVTGVCLAALALSAASSASAKDKKAPDATASASPAASMAPAKRGVPYHGKVASVDSAAKTFTITTKKGESRVFKMTEETKYMKDGQPATMTDVVADQEVRGQYLKMDDGTMMAKSVKLGVKPMKEGGKKHQKKTMEEGAEASPTATP